MTDITITKGDLIDMVDDGEKSTPHDSDAPEAVWEARGYTKVSEGKNARGATVQVWSKKNGSMKIKKEWPQGTLTVNCEPPF
jgi:hypothetical protein